MFLNEKVIDQYLCCRRNIELSFKFENYYIYVVPNKAHFLITVEYHSEIIYQTWINTWEEAIAKFDSLCNKHLVNEISKLEKE